MASGIQEPATTEEPPSKFTRPWPFAARIGVLVAMCLAAVIAGPILTGLKFDEDVTNWLPPHDPQARLLAWHRQQFPSDETVLVAWEGASLGDDRIEALAAALREEDWVNRVITPGELIERMTENEVPPDEARRRLRGLLLGEPHDDVTRTPAGLLVSFDDTDENIVRDYLSSIADHAERLGIDRNTVHFGGGSVAASELDRRLGLNRWNPKAPWYRPDERSPLVLSAVTALLMAIVLLRQIRLMFAVLGVVLLATAVGVSLLPATNTAMNMVLTVLSPLLLVLTLSAAIHVANYWRHAALTTPHRAIAAATARKTAAWPCTLASVTTAIGLASLLTSPLRPVRDFGQFSAIGVLIGLAAALFGLPAVLSLLPMGHPRPPGREAALWGSIGRAVCSRARLVSLLCLTIGIACAAGLMHFRTETRVISYFPSDSGIVNDYEFLERHLAGITPIDVVVTFDDRAREQLLIADRIELVRGVEDAIRSEGAISGTLALPDFMPKPSDLTLLQRSEYVRRRLPRVERKIAAGDDPEIAPFVRLAETGFAEDALTTRIAPGDELWQINAQVRVLEAKDYGAITDRVMAAAKEAIGSTPGVNVFLTGTVPLFLRTQKAVLDSLIVSFGLAFAMIAGVLMVVLRSVVGGLVAMLPNLLPVLVVFGAISWFGQAVDIGMMITASVALGIAVDGTLHLLTWYREGLAGGKSSVEAIAAGLSHCGPAMWHTSGIIGVSLLMLAFSDLLLIRRFGWLMAALIFAALIADLVYLPALLCGRFGRLIAPRPSRGEPAR